MRCGLKTNDFREITVSDIEVIKAYSEKYRFESCDFNAVNLFSWGHFINLKTALFRDRLLFYNFESGFMIYPFGVPFDRKELLCLSDMMLSEGMSGNFISVPEEYLTYHPEISENFQSVFDRDNSDYLYSTEKLAKLTGKKLHKKKNLVSQFMREYPGHKIEPFRGKYIGMCIEHSEKWCIEQSEICPDDKRLELSVMKRAVSHHELLGLEGLIVFLGNNPVAFSFFSRQNCDTVDVHFEKYDSKFKGSAQLINLETAKLMLPRYKFINREQDMGKEGLRQSKMTYDPLRLIPTYKLIRK
ncbi:MAG: phosphatidylglycerol lysyltransferase domain-containing protein [Candidatus Delongbacteria bacterium]